MEEIEGYKRHHERTFQHLLAGPFIHMLIVPFVITDIMVEIYHRICFPLYGLTYIKRSEYIIFDRQKLSYLPWYDKIYCTYCAYANGLFLFWVAIGSTTEKYWCGIKHQRTRIKALRDEEKNYLKFGDKKAFEELEKRKE